MAENFTVSLYLDKVLCIKISTPETISPSCLFLIHAYIWNDKTLTYLIKLVNLDTTR
jgi:hypothetical protein